MKKILLIEDDTALRENTKELLELSGYEVKTSADGNQGILQAKEYLPHVIICDIMMPIRDGYDVLKHLSKDEHTKGIPFIFLSAKTERQDIRKGMDLGADDYLTKPFQEHELIGAIESRLAKMAILNEIKPERPVAPLRKNQIKSIHELKNYIDDHGKEQSLETGETLFREGMHNNTVYLILKGAIKTHKLDEMGKELITGIFREDDFFGMECITKDTTHKEYATALESTELVGISIIEFRQLLNESQTLAIELMQYLSENLSEAKEQLLEMAYGSVRRRAASTILKFAQHLSKDAKGNLHVLRSDLASVAGVATETLIRTLSSFKREGLIEIKDRNIRVVDSRRLSEVS